MKLIRYFVALLVLWCGLGILAQAQVYELTCATGSPMYPTGVVLDKNTGKYRQWLCVDDNGNVTGTITTGGISNGGDAWPLGPLAAPTGANATLGPSTNGNNPVVWTQNGDSTYDTFLGIDTFCDNVNGPPCR